MLIIFENLELTLVTLYMGVFWVQNTDFQIRPGYSYSVTSCMFILQIGSVLDVTM